MPEPKTKLIAGQEFTISQPYVEGHQLTAAEAKQLNQVRAENIGNNLREAVKQALEKGTPSVDELRAQVADYDSKYNFSMGGGGGASRKDPVEREAIKLAKEAVKAHLLKLGRKLTDIPAGMTKEDWESKLEDSIESTAARPEILAEAKKNVAAAKKTSDRLLGMAEGLAL